VKTAELVIAAVLGDQAFEIERTGRPVWLIGKTHGLKKDFMSLSRLESPMAKGLLMMRQDQLDCSKKVYLGPG
jgi:hypothetical protein